MIKIWGCCSCCSLIAFEIVQVPLCIQLLSEARLIWTQEIKCLTGNAITSSHRNEWEGFNFQANIEILCVLCARVHPPVSFLPKENFCFFMFFKRFLGTDFFFINVFRFSCSILYILLQVLSILKWADFILKVMRAAGMYLKRQRKCAPQVYWFVPQETNNFDAKFHICIKVISLYESRAWSLIFCCRCLADVSPSVKNESICYIKEPQKMMMISYVKWVMEIC